LKRGGVFIDVGAYHGYFTKYACKLVSRKEGIVIAVEPDPDNYAVLRQSVPEGTKLVKAAIWINDGTAELRKGYSASTLTPLELHLERGLLLNNWITVKTLRLDTLIRQFNLMQVDLVKMDVEGAEFQILTDPKVDLAQIKAMMVEIHYPFTSHQSRAILASLKNKGFKLIPYFMPGEEARYHLYAFRP